MISYHSLISELSKTKLAPLANILPNIIDKGLCTQRFGDLPQWYAALNDLPDITQVKYTFEDAVILTSNTLSESDNKNIKHALQQLIPWRKGPFQFFDTHIDTEWRSDWKWNRLTPYISSLKNRVVLDVGCGNGYHCLRMFGAEASRVIGIDPSPRFVVQFYMLKHFIADIPVDVLPMGIETLPEKLCAFDTTFSMGVLYHRKSPIDHLQALLDTLKPGGELVLETLVIEGELGSVLVPEKRYAMMNNVWFLPSIPTLISWLKKVGFINIRCVDQNITSIEEQRATPWMGYHSLENFLDTQDKSKTVEGHPAPQRAIIIANKT